MRSHGRRSELNGWMMSYPEEMDLRIWGFWERLELKFDRWSERLGFSDLIWSDQLESRPAEMSRDLRHHKMYLAFGGGVNIGWLAYSFINCLSPPVTKGWKQKKKKKKKERNPIVPPVLLLLLLLLLRSGVYNRPTWKDFLTSALCEHGILSRGPTRSYRR